MGWRGDRHGRQAASSAGARPRVGRLSPSKQSIVWVLLLLVALFIAGIWVMSTLNLSYSQKAIGELRQAQLAEVFTANFDRINAHQQLLEHHTADLARLGELFWKFQRHGDQQTTIALKGALAGKLEQFAEAFGAGIWFDAGEFLAGESPYGIFSYRNDSDRLAFISPQEDVLQGYRQQPWFALAIPENWPTSGGLRDFYWTPAYYHPLSEAAVLTLVKPMYAPEGGRVIGVATTDWPAERLIDLVSQVDVTPNTFAFLIDRNNRQLSGMPESEEDRTQQVMDVILQVRLIDTLATPGKPVLPGLKRLGMEVQNHRLTVDGREYALSYAATTAGMLFGIGVPRDEIDAVLQPMRASNLQILLFTGLVMLGLSAVILFKVIGLMRQLQASYTDELTGLPNRGRLLEDFVQQPGGSLVLIDIDDFKEINGLFGHRCGDYVLQKLAGWLKEHITADPALAKVRLYRLTSDEFALLGPYRAMAEVHPLVQEISSFLQSRSPLWQGQEINLGITLGAAVQDPHHADPASPRDSLITWARFAIKQARRQHKNFLVYDAHQGVEEAYGQNLLWAGRVKKALLEDRIVPYFQPIHDNLSGQTSRFECLVRMQGDNGEVAGPGQFLEVARKLRLDRQITRVMIDKSLASFAGQPYDFSINLSCADLLDGELTPYILEKIDETNLGRRVIFEILESDGIENYPAVRKFIDEAKSRGCRIAIDDFGSGYSNFEHLLRLNVDLIKIDGSLIRNLDNDSGAVRIIQGIVNFARSLHMSTAAEFVHCETIQAKVAQLGVDYSQGAFFGMPRAQLAEHTTGRLTA